MITLESVWAVLYVGALEDRRTLDDDVVILSSTESLQLYTLLCCHIAQNRCLLISNALSFHPCSIIEHAHSMPR